jgi:hypothetical protein
VGATSPSDSKFDAFKAPPSVPHDAGVDAPHDAPVDVVVDHCPPPPYVTMPENPGAFRLY